MDLDLIWEGEEKESGNAEVGLRRDGRISNQSSMQPATIDRWDRTVRGLGIDGAQRE